jgi:hypothetical protein
VREGEPLEGETERLEVGIAAAASDLVGPTCPFEHLRPVAHGLLEERRHDGEVTVGEALRLVLEEALRLCEPAASHGELHPVRVVDREHQRQIGSASLITGPEVCLVRPLLESIRLVVAAGPVAGLAEALQILRVQRVTVVRL